MFSRRELRHITIEGAFLTAGALAVYTSGIGRYGLSTRARSVSFVALSAAQLLHAFSARSEKNDIFDSERERRRTPGGCARGRSAGICRARSRRSRRVAWT